MNDMSAVIVPKSDQLNSDTLISGPLTIRITGVDIRPGSEQPVTVSFDGDNGQPWKPCKSMCRLMVAAWGPDAKAYVGRSLTLYRDASVKWGGMEVGGIRISAMTHIEREMVLALTATKGIRKPYTVKPLKVQAPVAEPVAPAVDKAALATDALLARIAAVHDMDALAAVTGEDTVIKQRDWLKAKRPELAEKVDAAVMAALGTFDPPGDDMPDDSHIATG